MASVALIGPDGSGKTTVGQMLERVSPIPVKYIYMGTNTSASNIMLPTTRLAGWLSRKRQEHERASEFVFTDSTSPSFGVAVLRRIRRFARFANRIAEEAYRFAISGLHQLAGRLVIYDRHPLFDCAPVADERRRLWRLHWWLLSRFSPHPNLVVYLDAPVEVLLARKREFPRAELQQITKRLLSKISGQPTVVRVDAARPLEAICQDVEAEIEGFLQRRTVSIAQPHPDSDRSAAVRGERTERASTLRVLTYHRLAELTDRPLYNPSVVSATPGEFDRAMEWLSRNYQVVDVRDVLERLSAGQPMPERAVLLTFDDAYRDFARTAWPILKKHGLAVTLFVPTGFANGSELEFWWDRLYRAVACAGVNFCECEPLGRLPLATASDLHASFRRLRTYAKTLPHHEALEWVDDLCTRLSCPPATERTMLSWDELRALAQEGVALGSHTRSHPILTTLPASAVRDEISQGRDDLRREIGPTPPVFAYPAGACDPATAAIVKAAGYRLAFSTESGHNQMDRADLMRLRRTNITPRTTTRLLQLRLTALGGKVDRIRHRSRVVELPAGGRPAAPRIAYVMSRFPKLTETFILNEMIAVEKLGVEVEVFPLLRVRTPLMHPEAHRFMDRAHFHPFVSWPIISANFHYLWRRPFAYFRTLTEVMRGTWGSLNFFAGGLAIFPKSVRFAYEMKRQGITHIHAHFANHPALAAFVVHRLTGIPFSFTAHGFDLHVERRMLGKKLEASAFAVAISEYNRRLMVSESPGNADKIQVVHCGVDPSLFKPAPASRRDSTIEIVCVGALEPVKGHRYLIEACRIIRNKGVDFTCHFVGQGHLRGAIERQVTRADLDDRIVIHGGLTRESVAKLVASSDIVVLPSAPTRRGKREGIPVALMEAMAAGLPVVSTTTSGIPELVESGITGFLVSPADPQALASALQSLAADPALRQRMGAMGREKVLREFNQETSALQLVSFFNRRQQFPAPTETTTREPVSVVTM